MASFLLNLCKIKSCSGLYVLSDVPLGDETSLSVAEVAAGDENQVYNGPNAESKPAEEYHGDAGSRTAEIETMDTDNSEEDAEKKRTQPAFCAGIGITGALSVHTIRKYLSAPALGTDFGVVKYLSSAVSAVFHAFFSYIDERIMKVTGLYNRKKRIGAIEFFPPLCYCFGK